MPTKEFNVHHCLLPSDRKFCVDRLKITVIVCQTQTFDLELHRLYVYLCSQKASER